MRSLQETITDDLLLEMAIPLNDYKNRVDGLRLQLVENWCLCKYCQLYDNGNCNFNHWKIELRSHMDNIKSLNVKSGNKLKTLKKMLINDYDFDDPDTICRIIIGKFKRENIMDTIVLGSIASEFASSVNEFINSLGIDSITSDDYINHTFKI